MRKGLAFILLAGIASAAPAGIDAGRRIYREGVLASGEALQARLQGDLTLEGAAASCATCHRRSGMGSIEGGILVPPISGDILFRPTELLLPDPHDRRFEENQPARTRIRIGSAPVRPAYTVESLAAALRTGIGPAGRTLNPAMPRYRLDDAAVAELAAYLRSLSHKLSPGVDASAIHFATIVTDGLSATDQSAALNVIQAYFRRKNLGTASDLERRGRAPSYEEDRESGLRRWELHIWKLQGPPETWHAQLDALYQDRPVFAVVGGMAAGPWRPIAEFCEKVELPCLFPETNAPAISGSGFYSVYFSQGLAGEADVLAWYLRHQPGLDSSTRIAHVYRPDGQGAVAANAFRSALGQDRPLRDCPLTGPKPGPGFWKSLLRDERPGVLVAWLSDLDLEALGGAGIDLPQVYLSSSLAAPRGRALFTYPYWPPPVPIYLSAHVRGWMAARGIALTNERVQFDSYFALDLLDYSLTHMRDNFSRDYLIETVEREAETADNPGIFPRLSLGPGQRFASKGGYIVRLSDSGGVEPVSGWIVP